MKDDLISRQAAIDAIRELLLPDEEGYKGVMYRNQTVCNCVRTLYELPSVTPTERTGHWAFDKNVSCLFPLYRCSNCNKLNGNATDNYCAWCGTKMVEPQESEKV